jgi:hypothetical protein
MSVLPGSILLARYRAAVRDQDRVTSELQSLLALGLAGGLDELAALQRALADIRAHKEPAE